MVTVLLLVAAWAVMVPAVLALARVLGRVSTPPPPEADAPPAPGNVVALVPRPRNALEREAA